MSARGLRISMLALATIGLADAAYLTYIHYAGIKPFCGTNGGGCEIVQTSTYSELAGVPVALIGLIGYVVIVGSLLAPDTETTRFATVAFTVVGFGFSAYLTYRELFTIHHICEYCVGSAVIVTIVMCLAVWRFLRGAPPARGPTSDVANNEAGDPLGAAR